jgi:hypothetical protein|tara:strand:- start:8221 stop:9855 length:1635 start_codon:yes stop_codon:yes gene_type:complete
MAKKNINFNTYVERDLTRTTVDWGTVANNLTTKLGVIEKDREKRRAEIQNNTIEVENKLNTLEDYTNQTLQNLALGMSGDSANFLRVQKDLFDRGQITETQYAQAKQRVLGDWKQFGTVTKKFESQYAAMKGRIDSTEGSVFESIFSQQNAEFGNLKNVTGYVNPATGNLSLVQLDEDGKIPDDPSKHVSMNVINNRFNSRVDNVSYKDGLTNKLKSKVNTLGSLITASITATGDVFTREGQKQALESDDIQAFLDNTAKQYTVNHNTVFSILGDINGDYRPTFNADEAAADPYKVLVQYNSDGVPVPVTEGTNWDTQVQAAQEIIKDKMLLMLDDKETIKSGSVYSEYQKDLVAIRKQEAIDRKNKETPPPTDPYRDNNYSANPYGAFGDKAGDANVSVYDYLEDNLGSNLADNSDSTIKKSIKNSILGVIDPNLLANVNEGKYEGFDPLDFQFTDRGQDHFNVSFGDSGVIRYPPLETVTFMYNGQEYQMKGAVDVNGNVQKSIRDAGYNDPKVMYAFLQSQLIDPQVTKLLDLENSGELDD